MNDFSVIYNNIRKDYKMKSRKKYIKSALLKISLVLFAIILNPFQSQSNASIKDLVGGLSYNSAEKAYAISYPGASGGTVQVTGLIDPTLSFTLDAADMYFGSLSTSATKYATKSPTTGGSLSVPTGTGTTNFQTSTNSARGVTININDTYNGLRATTGAGSGVTVIAAAAAASAGAESFFSYGLVDASGGGLAMHANFSGTTGNSAIATTIKTFATSTVPLNSASARVIFAAKATTLTKSADYTDTATITCTANY